MTVGELVGPDKEQILTLADMSTVWVLADVPEAKLAMVNVGAAVKLRLAARPDVAPVAASIAGPKAVRYRHRREIVGFLVLSIGVARRRFDRLATMDGFCASMVAEEHG